MDDLIDMTCFHRFLCEREECRDCADYQRVGPEGIYGGGFNERGEKVR
ncbi:MAG TPA: hypothetical protein VNX25_00080 [Verrucomicrobiae bacterium]|nr:hypothetical protein [Verrucomicrobiae bacterium]